MLPAARRNRPSKPPGMGSLLRPGVLSGLALGAIMLPGLAFAQQAPDGGKVFTSAGCAGCHGQEGNGAIGPKLAGNQKLSDANHVITQILNGGGAMPAFKDQLSKEEIAAVATYIRTNFGNTFGPVTADQVAQLAGAASGGGNGGGGNNAGGGNNGGGDAGGGANAGAASSSDVSASQPADASSQASAQASASAPSSAQVSDTENPAGGEAQAGDDKSAQQQSQEGNQQQDPMQVGAAATDVAQPSTNKPEQAELDGAGTATDSWLMYNKGYDGQRYSGLDLINTQNVANLAPVCIAQLGEQSSFQASPVIYDGLLYITTSYSTYALDARTCQQKWVYTYSPKGAEPFNTNRGIAIAGGRVFRGTSDAHFIALDAKTGKLLWNVRPVDSKAGYFLSSAPIVWHDMVFTGTAGADWGASAMMFAFDVKDGHTVWSFDQIVDETFGGADPAATGGGSNWTSYALDTQTGKIYVPVGNPAPDFAPQYRPGKNLYTDSVLVLDAQSGKLDHYYQQIPNDALDRDTAASPILFRATNASGTDTLYTVAANKAGHMYLYNEDTKQQIFKSETTTISNEGAPPTTEGVHVCPGIDGGVEWYGPAYDPKTFSLYVGSVDWCTTFSLGEVRYTPGQLFFGGSYVNDPVEDAQGWIRAYDPQTGNEKWRYKSALPVVAGVTPTAGGLVFSGELTGDFIALDSKSGKKLYSFYTGGPIGGGVSTYQVDGKQYVAVASGNQSRTWSPSASPSATVVIFALPGSAVAGSGSQDAASQASSEASSASSGEQAPSAQSSSASGEQSSSASSDQSSGASSDASSGSSSTTAPEASSSSSASAQ